MAQEKDKQLCVCVPVCMCVYYFAHMTKIESEQTRI